MEFIVSTNPKLSPMTFIMGAIGIAAGIYGFYSVVNHEEHEEDQNSNAIKPAGIFNEGNTCFVNSLLQALASVELLTDNFLKVLKAHQKSDKHYQLIRQLWETLQRINKNTQSIDVHNLLQLISQVKPDFINLEQQDTHELFLALISQFEILVNRSKSLDLSASIKMQEDEDEEIENQLLGYTKSSIICQTCFSETSIKIESFYDLSLEINFPHIYSIQSAIKWFQREEKIQNWTCAKCSLTQYLQIQKSTIAKLNGINKQILKKIGQQMIKHLSLEKFQECDLEELNQSLSFFVKKYEVEYNQMIADPERDLIFRQVQPKQTTISKRNVIIRFPKIMVFHFKQLTINPMTGEPFLLRKSIDFSEQLNIKTKSKIKKYKLTSLLTHFGTESMGHYFTFRKYNKTEDDWFVISDSSCRKCEWNLTKKYPPYMLFYEVVR